MKILLLSDMAPCINHTSGLVINKWCDFLLSEGIEIHCALIKDKFVNMVIPEDKQKKVKFIVFDKPNELWISEDKRFNKLKGKIKSYKENTKSAKIILPQMAKKIANYAKRNKIDLILTSIQGQSMTKIVRKVSKFSGIEYVAQTWDPLEWWMKEFKFDKLTYNSNLREFGRVVKHSKNFIAMSWAMAKAFEKKYHKKCLVNIPSLPLNELYKKEHSNKDEFIIAFAGQTYAKKEIELLISTLNELNWRYNGKEIVLRVYGQYFPQEYYTNPNIEVNGFVKQDKLIETLRECDLLYCPYWFSKEYIKPCKLSFPGKLTTYLSTGIPVLLHGPKYASPIIFAKINKAGYIINTNDKIKFKQELIKIFKNYDVKVGENGWNSFKNYLTDDIAKKNLLAAINVIDSSCVEQFNELKKNF